MKPAEVLSNGSSHLIYTTLKTIESYTLKSTYFPFFLLLHYSNVLIHQGLSLSWLSLFLAPSQSSALSWWHLPFAVIWPNLHQSKSRSSVSPGHLEGWQEVGPMSHFRCPKPCVIQVSMTASQSARFASLLRALLSFSQPTRWS